MSQKLPLSQNISIAVVGHTNTGKTTLIRTLMKTSIGEVGDSANVTKKGQSYFFEGLQATFIDTPGFQYASNLMMHLDLLKENPDFKTSQSWQEKMVYDLDAIASIESTDVVLYVASLTIVPDDNYKEEISLILKKCSKRDAHLSADVDVVKDTGYGTRYEISAYLSTPVGRQLLVRTVWQIDKGTDFPRLITLIPD